MDQPIIALLTDYGEDDFFVASLKAVIFNINPVVRIVDLTHSVKSFDIQGASFILYSCYKFFPAKTIFLTVVDPGVGSKRRILLLKTKKFFFIAPDNGLLSYVLDTERPEQVINVINKKFFLEVSQRTFEGRDRMAPVAAWLSRGVAIEEFGPVVSRCQKLKIPKPRYEKKSIYGHVLYIDKFGNLITNIPVAMVDRLQREEKKRGMILSCAGKKIRGFRETYSCAKKGELFFLPGSLGTIEIASREASALQKLKAERGEEVQIFAWSEK